MSRMDLIERQAAVDAFEPWLKVSGYSEGELNMLKAVLYELRFLPSAQLEFAKDMYVLNTDCISRQAAIDALDAYIKINRAPMHYGNQFWIDGMEDAERIIKELQSAQPEPCEDKLKEIADALSEKMCYMNTCPNERDIILGYLGRKRSSKNHCNTDCWNEKCESYHYETRKQLEPCELCSNLEKGDTLYQWSDWDGGIGFDYIRDIRFCPKCGRRLLNE